MAANMENVPGSDAESKFAEIVSDLATNKGFEQKFQKGRLLGMGGDGIVYSYKHCATKQYIAIKSAHADDQDPNSMLKEVKNLLFFQGHQNVIRLLGYDMASPCRPKGIYLEFCDLGDLPKYRRNLLQEYSHSKMSNPPEITVWKLLGDMSLALNFIHNKGFVHGDFKCANILVSAPPGCTKLPIAPIFKVSDFARLARYSSSPKEKNPIIEWNGTYEYGPPMKERTGPVKPSIDMWSLGATIQTFALGQLAIESEQACAKRHQTAASNEPENTEQPRDCENKRKFRQTVYRPIDQPAGLMIFWDICKPLNENYKPYSHVLNDWYKALWDEEAERITAADLVQYVIPSVPKHFRALEEMNKGNHDIGQARLIRDAVAVRQAGRMIVEREKKSEAADNDKHSAVGE